LSRVHAREGAQPRLGFREGEAYRGRRGQASAGIGRGKVREGRCRRETCMHGLGFGSRVPPRFRRLRQWRHRLCLFLHEIESKVRSRCCGCAPSVQRRSREGARNGRRQPPPLPSIYHSSDELRRWIGIGFEVEWLGE
jgi:hypothetical protein